MRHARPFLLAAAPWLASALFAGASCTGDIGGEGEDIVPPPPDVEPKQVPSAPELISSTSTCAPRRPDEQLLSVSPEGHAWMLVAGAPNSVRILDPFEPSMVETIEGVDIADIAAGQAWSARDAALVADGGLWRLDDLARIELTPPTGFATPASFCGDPGENGLIVSAGQVFERRSDQWWAWNPGVEADGAPRAVLGFDGECQSTDDLTWLTAADGTLYRVEPAQYSRPVRFASLVDAAATQGMVAVLESDKLWIGPDAWQSWIFPGATPTQLAASAGHLWMVSGAQLLRFDGTTFVEVTHGMSEPIERVAAHPNGVWTIGASVVCHQSVGTMLRVDGVRPYARSSELDHVLRVKPSDEAVQVSADIDGIPIELLLDAETGWLEGDVRLDGIGWHTISLSDAAGSVHRSIAMKRLPEITRSWAADIAPIYERSCTGSDCHQAGSTDPPDLGTYEAWTERSAAIRTRVVEARTMPPAANIGPEWGTDDIDAIQEWLEGGMLP